MHLLFLHRGWKLFCLCSGHQSWYLIPDILLGQTLTTTTAALTYPERRGTATAFPLAAFGLSALFFAGIAQLLPGGTYNFLILLATGTVALPLISLPFMRIYPHHSHHHSSEHERQALHRSRFSGSHPDGTEEPGALNTTHKTPISTSTETHSQSSAVGDGENSSLLSQSSGEDIEDLSSSRHTEPDRNNESPHLDIRGLALLPHAEFWQLFCMLGLLTGIGLMTIK
jgi:hypothetical protein